MLSVFLYTQNLSRWFSFLTHSQLSSTETVLRRFKCTQAIHLSSHDTLSPAIIKLLAQKRKKDGFRSPHHPSDSLDLYSLSTLLVLIETLPILKPALRDNKKFKLLSS